MKYNKAIIAVQFSYSRRVGEYGSGLTHQDVAVLWDESQDSSRNLAHTSQIIGAEERHNIRWEQWLDGAETVRPAGEYVEKGTYFDRIVTAEEPQYMVVYYR